MAAHSLQRNVRRASNTHGGLGGEPLASSPLWLAHSGLPELLNRKVNRTAWLVFKTVVELDCLHNARPGTLELPPSDLAKLCGLPADGVMRTLEGLRKQKCLALFLPDHPDEIALLEVKVPLPAPKKLEDLRQEFPFNRLGPSIRFRYASLLDGSGPDSRGYNQGGSKSLDRVIDLYFQRIGFKMNSFVLDELNLICQRFAPSEVEKAFARAAKNDIRSLHWVVKELYRISRRHDHGKK